MIPPYAYSITVCGAIHDDGGAPPNHNRGLVAWLPCCLQQVGYDGAMICIEEQVGWNRHLPHVWFTLGIGSWRVASNLERAGR
jgi:hypothetical protein